MRDYRKNKMKSTRGCLPKCLIHPCIILAIIGIIFTGYVYLTEPFVEDVAQYVNPANNYRILFQTVGSPDWPFGEVDVRIKLLNDKNKTIELINTSLQNDGKTAQEENISIKWFEQYVEVILLSDEQEDDIYHLYYH